MLSALLPRSWLATGHGIGNATHHTMNTHQPSRLVRTSTMASELLNDDVDVCVDCYMDHHEGRAMKDASVDWTDNTFPDGAMEPTGVTDFSSKPCACCGSHLAGARFRMAIWTLPTTEAEGADNE